MPDALCVAKELDAVLLNQFPTAHQPTMDLLFWRALLRLHAHDALIVAWLARIASFTVALARKPSACHAAVLRVA